MSNFEEEIIESLENLVEISKSLQKMPSNTGELLVAMAHKFFMNYIPQPKQ